MAFSDTAVERCLIGTLLHNGFLVKSVINRLEPTSFLDETCEEVFRIIVKLYRSGSEIDQNTINYASEFPLDEDEISDLLSYNEPDKIEGYARSVAKQSASKKLENIFGDIGDASPEEFIGKKMALLNGIKDSINQDLSASKDATALGELFLTHLKSRAEDDVSSRIKTGIRAIDRITSGLEPSWLVVVGARPSMGKTTLCLNIVEYVCLTEKKRAMFFSLEMPAVEVSNKFISSIGNINNKNIRTGKLSHIEADRIHSTVDRLKEMDVVVDDKAGQTWEEIEFKIRREHHKSPLSLVVIDYLQLVNFAKDNRSETEKIGEISKNAKNLAKDLNLTMILLAQLNRDIEKRADKRPLMSDLRASGQIEQDADLILFPYREFVYTQDPEKRDVADIIFGKFRHGECEDVTIKFIGKYSKFCDAEPVCYNNMNGNNQANAISTGTLMEANI